MKKETRTFWVLVLACGLVLSGSVLVKGDDFYVIPMPKKGSNVNPAPVPKTGQTECYKSSEPWITCTCGTSDCPSRQDGDLGMGMAWPNPRFTDNGNGTVSDNLTGLFWTKNANCDGVKLWSEAISYCNGLASGTCGLNDGSQAGDWRLPNLRELQSLIHYGYWNPALPNTAGSAKWTGGDPFTNAQSSWDWTSSTYAGSPDYAWFVHFDAGHVGIRTKDNYGDAWCVRAGQ